MIPSVFISSTIEDLHHVRDAVRETISELGYQPIMSERGDVGYMNETAADAACYQSVKECQLMVLIIGKRYGSKTHGSGTVSVTEHEYDTCMEHKPKLITFVDGEVLNFKRVYDANPDAKKDMKYPGMDDAIATFSFVDKVKHGPIRNAIIPFSTVSDVRSKLKIQLATLFHDLLEEHTNASKSTLDEIMAEVKTIRNALSEKAPPDMRFLAVFKYLLDEENREFSQFLKYAIEDIENAIPLMYEAEDFDDFAKRKKFTVDVSEEKDFFQTYKDKRHFVQIVRFIPGPFILETGERNPVECCYAIDSDGNVVMNTDAYDFVVKGYADLRKRIDSVTEKPSGKLKGSKSLAKST